MDLSERILLSLSRTPKAEDYSQKEGETTIDNALNSFDVVISENSFEHFANPEKVLDDMVTLLADSGIILITLWPPFPAVSAATVSW